MASEVTSESSTTSQYARERLAGMSNEEAFDYNSSQLENVKGKIVQLQKEIDEYDDESDAEQGSSTMKPCSSDSNNTLLEDDSAHETKPDEAPHRQIFSRCMWDELPVELFDEIISHLPLYAIDSLRYASKGFFRQLSKPVYTDQLYKKLRKSRLFCQSREEYNKELNAVEAEVKLHKIESEKFLRSTWRYPTIKLDWDLTKFGEEVTFKIDRHMLIVWSLKDPGQENIVDRVMGMEPNLWLYTIEDAAPRYLTSTRTPGLVSDVIVHYGTQQDSIKILTKFRGPWARSASAAYQLWPDFSLKRPIRNPLGVVDYKNPQRKGYMPTYSLRKITEYTGGYTTHPNPRLPPSTIPSTTEANLETDTPRVEYKTIWVGANVVSADRWVTAHWKPMLDCLQIIEETKYNGPNQEPHHTLFLAHASSTDNKAKPTLFASIFTTENLPIKHISVSGESNRPCIPLFPKHTCKLCSPDCDQASNGVLLSELSHPTNGILTEDEISPGNVKNTRSTTYLDVVFSSACQTVRIFRIAFLQISRLLQVYRSTWRISPPDLNLTERFTIRTKIITQITPSKNLTIKSLQQVRYLTGPPVLYIGCVTTSSVPPLEVPVEPGRTPPGSDEVYDKNVRALSNVPSPATSPALNNYLALKDLHRRQSALTTSLQIFICDEEDPKTCNPVNNSNRLPFRCEGRSMQFQLKFTGDEGVLEELGMGWGSRWDVGVDLPKDAAINWISKRIEGFGSGGEEVVDANVDRSGKGGSWWSRLLGA
ncbi:hypothetical protein BJ508DRAFT_331551 [Ascobolus immersus RN42]|uniref:F-box domain-containing protein n=1 Tax=Ascobolus immersus RN42 TaxID=1160509 RepID=A0A3N4HQG2_ASCIM|nr:hypothetical protein BJ508DRAFT_331551 [Ascobolus immersus RN42]